MKEEKAEQRNFLIAFADRFLSQQGNTESPQASGSGAQSRRAQSPSPSPPPQQKTRRKTKSSPYKDDPRKPMFLVSPSMVSWFTHTDWVLQDCIRAHLKRLLNITSLDESLLEIPPLTEEEVTAHKNAEVGCVTVTAETFRMDFSRNQTSFFNLEAIEVFTEHFIKCVDEDGWYRDADIPEEFLQPTVVMAALQKHLKYVFQVYRRVAEPQSPTEVSERKTRASRSTRKGWVRPVFIWSMDLDS